MDDATGRGAPATTRWSGHDGDAYDAPFLERERAGIDVHGEARLVLSLGPRTVLDAGCGTGRVAVELAQRGISVVGVDLDPLMLDAARRKASDLDWRLGDLAGVTLNGPDGERLLFDVAVAAGNVMIFLTPGSEGAVVRNLARHLVPGGALVAGFQLIPRGLDLAAYDACAHAAGLVLADRWATWDREPFRPGGDYAVSVHRRPAS